MSVYLDNAATTPLDPEVFRAMEPYLFGTFGNPSSAHSHGRAAKLAVEDARQTLADLLSTEPSKIVFTSGGTEGDNTAILSAIQARGISFVITSRLEHHAVLHTLRVLEQQKRIQLAFIDHDRQGNLSLTHLERLLAKNPQALVSVMHANNELGNLNDIAAIGAICTRYRAVFHSDTVQTMGHYTIDPKANGLDFFVGSAHKFHGPKGVGFLCFPGKVPVRSLLHGGGQESKLRAGTENVAGIVGLVKALEIAYRDLAQHRQHIAGLKFRLATRLKEQVPGIAFNGTTLSESKSLYTVLSASFPNCRFPLIEGLDGEGISVSGGSACTSGYARSHVLEALDFDFDRTAIRFSFSRYTTEREIDYVAERLTRFVGKGELQYGV